MWSVVKECDGTAPNEKFVKMHTNTSDEKQSDIQDKQVIQVKKTGGAAAPPPALELLERLS